MSVEGPGCDETTEEGSWTLVLEYNTHDAMNWKPSFRSPGPDLQVCVTPLPPKRKISSSQMVAAVGSWRR